MAILPFIAPALELFNGVIKRVLPEKMSEKDAAEMSQALTLELMKADWTQVAGQMAINAEEAKHPNVFVSGWRPYIGWVCGTALAYHFIVQPWLAFTIAFFKWQTPPIPAFDMGALMTVLTGMLGIAGMRTYEKVKGVARG